MKLNLSLKLKPWSKRASNVLKETWAHMRKAKLLLVASSLAYTTILSIIPLLAVSFAIFQAFGGLDKLYDTLSPLILQNLTEGTSQEVIDTLRGFIANAHANAIGAGGLIALILTSMSMLSSAENAINQVWQTTNTRSVFQRVSAYWLFITLGPLALAVIVGAATSTDFPLTKLLPSGTGIFVITVALFFVIYKWVPNCVVKWQYALLAAFATSIFWNLARLGYALYTKKVIAYNKIYGSLGAIPILLLWIYIVWLIILTGAALSAAMQKQFNARVTNGN